jgi:hypothetical protein
LKHLFRKAARPDAIDARPATQKRRRQEPRFKLNFSDFPLSKSAETGYLIPFSSHEGRQDMTIKDDIRKIERLQKRKISETDVQKLKQRKREARQKLKERRRAPRKEDFQKLMDQIVSGEIKSTLKNPVAQLLRVSCNGVGAQRIAFGKVLHVGPNTIKAWTQAERTQEPPEWAFELLCLKTGVPYPFDGAENSEQAA